MFRQIKNNLKFSVFLLATWFAAHSAAAKADLDAIPTGTIAFEASDVIAYLGDNITCGAAITSYPHVLDHPLPTHASRTGDFGDFARRARGWIGRAVGKPNKVFINCGMNDSGHPTEELRDGASGCGGTGEAPTDV